MSSIAEIITASIAGLGSVGGAAAFVWNKIEKRFNEIDLKLAECEKRDRESQERRAVQLTVIELLWQEVKRLAPDAAVLERASKLLDSLKSKSPADE